MQTKNIFKSLMLSIAVSASVMSLIGCSSETSQSKQKDVVTQTESTQLEKISKPGVYQGYSEARFDGYDLSSQYVAMRDGTRLAVDIFRPTLNGEVVDEKFPVLWMHTPYHRRNYGGGLTGERYPGKALKLVKYGYNVAIVDFRGLFASFGKNVGYNRGEWQDAARMDAYDVTEWLAKQSWSNGNIGMWGCSATGGSQMQALTVAPPSLKAVFPMSCEWDVYPFASTGGVSPPEGVPTRVMRGGSREARDKMSVPVDGDENKTLMMQAIAEHKDNIETAGFTPFRDSKAANFDNQWWLKSSPYMYKDTIEKSGVAIYSAANLDEEGPGYGPYFTFNNVSNPRKLIVGPGTHCDWTTVEKETGFDILVEELRFFDRWLKEIDNGIMKEDPVTYFTYNVTENNGWKTASAWPLPNEKLTEFYLHENGLSKTQSNNANAADKTLKTVDYEITNDNFWSKGVVFKTAPLAEDVQITGHPRMKLFLSTTATDADVIARIDDVAPDGSHRYYTVEGKIRASLRKTEEPPYNNLGLPWHPFTEDSVQTLKPNEIVEVDFDFYVMSYLFKKGHQIRVTLNFADQRATPRVSPAPDITLYHSEEYPSALTLPVIQ